MPVCLLWTPSTLPHYEVISFLSSTLQRHVAAFHSFFASPVRVREEIKGRILGHAIILKDEIIMIHRPIYSLSQDSSVGIVTRLRTGEPSKRGSISGRGKRFLSFLSESIETNLGPTQPPVRYAPRRFLWGKKAGTWGSPPPSLEWVELDFCSPHITLWHVQR